LERLGVVAALTALVFVAAHLIRRGRPTTPAVAGEPGKATVPQHLDRSDFDRPEAPWLVVAFTSATCDSCAAVAEGVRPLAGADVAVAEIEAAAQPDLHRRYRVDAVPTVVFADGAGQVRRWFLGPVSRHELEDALGELRR
jgi:hypothetical protein